MDMHELVRQMERAERVWPDERPWAIQVLAGYLHIQSTELLSLFQQINTTLETERDQVLPEDLRLLKAYCERILERSSQESIEDKRREQVRARKTILSLYPKICEMMATKDHVRALNSYIYLLGESGEFATPEEKAQWYEEMGRLCLKLKRHPNEAARYFRAAVNALSLLEEAAGIQDLLDTYSEEFETDEARRSWDSVLQTAKEALSKLNYSSAS